MEPLRPWIKSYCRPAFVVSMFLLVGCGACLSVTMRVLGGTLHKAPLLLRSPLEALDEQALMPFKVMRRRQLDDPDVLASLGTRDFIQWDLVDTQANPDDPAGQLLLFITYYPLADKVPHVPEECYLGGGYQRLATDTVRFSLTSEHASEAREIKGRYVLFGAAGGAVGRPRHQVPVLYFFRVNGQYAASRQEARWILNQHLLGKANFFSKVELVYPSAPHGLSRQVVLDRAQTLLSRLVPLLEQDHWPEWSTHTIASKGKETW